MKATFIAMSFFVASIILSAATYNQLPDRLAVHWTNGEVTNTLPTLAAVSIMPAFMLLMFFINYLFNRQAKVTQFIYSVLPAFLFIIHAIIILSGLDYTINVEVTLGISLGALMMLIGNIMPQVKRNAIFGARNRWTLQNDKVWAIVNRLAGKLFFACGLLIFIGSIIAPSYQMAVILIPVLLIVVIIQFYSAVTYRRITSN